MGAFQGLLDPHRRNHLLLCCVLLAGCSSGAGGSVPLTTAASGASPLARTSTSPSSETWFAPDSGALKELAVSNYGAGSGAGDVQFFNKNYEPTGSIIYGLNSTDGIWLDAKGNLYAANLSGTVTEYAPGASSPTFTYSAGMTHPIAVTTDKNGNVYVGEGDTEPGYVDEFPQGSNIPIARCATPNGGQVGGVTVDKKGDVFVASGVSASSSALVEYPGGLRSCSSAVLPVPVDYVGGIELDLSGNLVVEEQILGEILIIPPPYSNVQTTLLGFGGDPYQVALNADNTLMFVVEASTGVVVVAQYPSGTIEKTLTNDITSPTGVAVYPPPKPAR